MEEKTEKKSLDEELKRYRDKNPELAEILDFYKEVFEIQESARNKIGPIPLLKDAAGKLKSERFILQDGCAPPIDYELFRETAQALGRAFGKMSGKEFPTEKLLALPQLQPENIDEFAADILANRVSYLSDFAAGTEFNEETIFHFLHSLVIPFFQADAGGYAEVFEEVPWLKGICPYCGSQPRYARFHNEDGRRLLYCPLCRSEWRYLRICCPFCGNSDHRKLRHAQLPGDQGHRVDVCDVCKHYIKTTNERQLERETIPQVEDVATIALDYLATKEGYCRDA